MQLVGGRRTRRDRWRRTSTPWGKKGRRATPAASWRSCRRWGRRATYCYRDDGDVVRGRVDRVFFVAEMAPGGAILGRRRALCRQELSPVVAVRFLLEAPRLREAGHDFGGIFWKFESDDAVPLLGLWSDGFLILHTRYCDLALLDACQLSPVRRRCRNGRRHKLQPVNPRHGKGMAFPEAEVISWRRANLGRRRLWSRCLRGKKDSHVA